VQLAKQIGSPTHKVQLMKASFFMEEEGDLEAGKFTCDLILWAVNFPMHCKLHNKDFFSSES
jgi:hypothetical protein